MSCKVRRIATLAVGCVVTGTLLSGAGPASAEHINLPLSNFAVYGSLTPKKLNEPVILPKHSTFNGAATLTKLTETETEGTVRGKLYVPPFTASLKLAGAVPTTVGVTLTEVGESEGTITTVPFSECAHTRVGIECITMAVNAKANIGLTAAGVLGIEVPMHCETTEPVLLPLRSTFTTAELLDSVHFTGTVTIPSIKCEEGLQGTALGLLLTGVMSGPENPYAIGLAEKEPTPPVVTSERPSYVSQISAVLLGNAVPSGEPITDCHFEYGTSKSYGTSIPCQVGPRRIFAWQANLRTLFVTGLSENTTYHYRLVATNSLGTSDGADQAFTTPGPPTAAEYGRCVAQKHGEYRDAGCTSKSKKAKKGKFEWIPGPAPACSPKEKGEYTDAGCTVKSKKPHKGSFEKNAGPKFTATSGAVTLETGAGKVTCAASAGAGEITGVYTGTERITFTGCEKAGKKCTSEGTNGTASGTPGSIETNLLATRLLGPVEGQAWIELSSGEHQPYLAELGCEGQLLRVSGHASGVQAGDVGTGNATSTTTFAATAADIALRNIIHGEQLLFSELSENGGSSWGTAAASVLTVTLTNTAELSTLEIRP